MAIAQRDAASQQERACSELRAVHAEELRGTAREAEEMKARHLAAVEAQQAQPPIAAQLHTDCRVTTY